MLDLLDEYALRVIGLAGQRAADDGRPAVTPDDVTRALCDEHPDLLDFALSPQSATLPPLSAAVPARPAAAATPAALLPDPRTRTLLRAAVTDASRPYGPLVVGVGNLLMGALVEAAQRPAPAPDDETGGFARTAHSVWLPAVRDQVLLFDLDTPLDNWFVRGLQDNGPKLVAAAARAAAEAGSTRIEPPHLLRALHSDGFRMVRQAFSTFGLDVDELPIRTGPSSCYERGGAGARPSFSLDALRAMEYAKQLEDAWTGQQPVQVALLCALFATWPPAQALLRAAGVTSEDLENLLRAERDRRTLAEPALVRLLLARQLAGSDLEPLVDGSTVLARRCLLAAHHVAVYLEAAEVTPSHVGVAALHLGGADADSSLGVALTYLRTEWRPIAETVDRPVPEEVVTEGWYGQLRPLRSETVDMLRRAPAIATRLRRDAVDTCTLFLAACARDHDLLSSLQLRGGGTIDLLATAAATNARHVSGPDAVVHPPRRVQPRRPVLAEPATGPADLGARTTSAPDLRELVLRGESTTGEFVNTDLQLTRVLRWQAAVAAETACAVLRLAGTVGAAAASGQWWLLATWLGGGLRPSRVPTWLVVGVEAVLALLLPVWLGILIGVSLVLRGMETWWTLQWRRGATGDPTYDLRRMRRDNWYSISGGSVNMIARRWSAARQEVQPAAPTPT